MRVIVGVAALASMLSFPTIDARAQSPSANLYVVVLTTVEKTAQRPATPLPEGFRDKSLYWRLVKSGDTVTYQLALGFFDVRSDAERAQQQLAANYREARVFSVSPSERESVLKAQAPITPAPPAQEISLALPLPLLVQESSPLLPQPATPSAELAKAGKARIVITSQPLLGRTADVLIDGKQVASVGPDQPYSGEISLGKTVITVPGGASVVIDAQRDYEYLLEVSILPPSNTGRFLFGMFAAGEFSILLKETKQPQPAAKEVTPIK